MCHIRSRSQMIVERKGCEGWEWAEGFALYHMVHIRWRHGHGFKLDEICHVYNQTIKHVLAIRNY